MIVQFQGNEPSHSLTAGRAYLVVGRDPQTYSVVDDRGWPGSFPRDAFSVIDTLPESRAALRLAGRRDFEPAYRRLVERVQLRRPDLPLGTLVVSSLEPIRNARRLVFGRYSFTGVEPVLVRHYRDVVARAALLEGGLTDLTATGCGAARVYAACALSELRGDRSGFDSLAGEQELVIVVRPDGGLAPVSVAECASRLMPVAPFIWDLAP